MSSFIHFQKPFKFAFLFSLAVANTDLIRYFLVFEPKLRSLLYTIRLWIKQKDLLGKGHRFNTYTLFWMIVCTLQLENQQLPSVQSLAERASK
jgi:DNA polymerase sigma